MKLAKLKHVCGIKNIAIYLLIIRRIRMYCWQRISKIIYIFMINCENIKLYDKIMLRVIQTVQFKNLH